ncbi:MAG: YggS family pyridoxal phosphate-dependent enzyme [Candidatus Saganbacteria bacterium]|nr:YggS family pyridoxal phosphate-dependent enzyme [Candidatus Saganbacteria bacterium]
MSIKENLELVRRKIAAAAAAAGRDPGGIKLVGVIKNVPLADVESALAAGLTDLGENRVQEAEERDRLLRAKYPAVSFHLIGHLQRNKVRQALDMFDIIQSLDSERLAAAISRRALQPVPVLIEVNTSGESSKFGIEPEQAETFVRYVSSLEKIKISGLMTIGPLAGEPRAAFRRLRELRDRIAALGLPGVEMRYLSMGMSGDFEAAVAEGADLLRIGRAIFSKGG